MRIEIEPEQDVFVVLDDVYVDGMQSLTKWTAVYRERTYQCQVIEAKVFPSRDERSWTIPAPVATAVVDADRLWRQAR